MSDQHRHTIPKARIPVRKHAPLDASQKLVERRALLRMGMAGMPMLMTMKASAQTTVVSQLQCTITVPTGYAALIDENGAVWLADIGWSSVPPLTQDVIDEFKAEAESGGFVFPDGTADGDLLPDGDCQVADDDDNDDDDDGGRKKKKKKKKKKKNDDDDGGDDDEDATLECKYNVVIFDAGDSFPISDHADEFGNLDFSGSRGFYLQLGSRYLQDYPGGTDFPGISCLVSVLNYAGNS